MVTSQGTNQRFLHMRTEVGLFTMVISHGTHQPFPDTEVLAFAVSLWLPKLSTRVPSALVAILIGTGFEWAIVRCSGVDSATKCTTSDLFDRG